LALQQLSNNLINELNYYYIVYCIIIITTTTTNLVTYLDFTIPLVSSQRQGDVIYFDLSDAFDLVRNTLLHHQLTVLRLFR
jgi:hypothetical protein